MTVTLEAGTLPYSPPEAVAAAVKAAGLALAYLPEEVVRAAGPEFEVEFIVRMLPGCLCSPQPYTAEAYAGRVIAAEEMLRSHGIDAQNWSLDHRLRVAAGALEAARALVA